MKKWLPLLLVAMLTAALAACGQTDKNTSSEDDVLLPLEVELTVTEEVGVNEDVQMKAVVSQGEEMIEDADEVVYEVWEEGKKEDSVMIDSVNEKKGVYTATTSFDHDGIFHIQVHVTARALHTMPVKKVVVKAGAQ